MKKFLLFSACAIMISCNNKQNTNTMETKEIKIDNAVFPKGEKGSSDYFTGTVWVESLVNPDDIEGLYSVGQVTFEPGAKTNWHTHPIGQVLLVLDGKGHYQERGQPAQDLIKGSVVVIPKDVEHWHGASHDTKLVHIAISNMYEGNNVTWLTPVTNEEYNSLLE